MEKLRSYVKRPALTCLLYTSNDGLNIALPEIAKGAGLDYELCLSMGTVAGFVGVAMMLVIAKFRDRFGGRTVSYTHLDVYKRQFTGCKGSVDGMASLK